MRGGKVRGGVPAGTVPMDYIPIHLSKAERNELAKLTELLVKTWKGRKQ